jgi:2-aminobenzoate-CoA ligase
MVNVNTHSGPQIDTFVRDHLPSSAQLPQLQFDSPELMQLSRQASLNAVTTLFAKARDHSWLKRPFLRNEREIVSYEEAAFRVDRIAQVLVEDWGLQVGNRVLLRGGNSVDLALAWLAIAKAGLVVVATMPLLRAKELSEIIHKAQVRHALCDAALAEELTLAQAAQPLLAHCLYFNEAADVASDPDSLASLIAKKSGTFKPPTVPNDHPALLAFTSGTTGVPKAVVHSHRDLLAACECWPKHILQACPDDIVVGTPPLAFTFGLGGLLLFPMWAGASVYFPEKPYSPELMVRLIEKIGATISVTAPTFYRLMVNFLKLEKLPSLRISVSAGEALPDATRQLWKLASGIEMLDGIGATEMFHIFISSAGAQVRRGAIGKVVPGYRAQVVDDEGNPVPIGTIGKLAVQGPTGCRYLDDPRQAGYVKQGWNYPGDAFTMDADGYFFYQSRADDMIITSGYNVGGPEVESCLLQHAAVAECAVIGKPDPERGMIVKACIVLRAEFAKSVAAGSEPERDALIKQLQDYVKGLLAPYKYPREIEFMAQLPRTETGKLQRFKLRAAQSEKVSTPTPKSTPALHSLQPADWKAPKGYANGIAASGTIIFVGGQIGWNAQQVFESDDFIEQTRLALQNIVAILHEGGAGPEHIARLTWYVTSRTEYLSRLRELGAVYREVMGRHFPAMSCVEVSALMEARAKIEIEATAVV